MSAAATAATAVTGRARVGRDSSRVPKNDVAATTATPASTAATVSARPGSSACWSPSIHEIPTKRVTIHPAAAPRLTSARALAVQLFGRTNPATPTSSWAIARTTNSTASVTDPSWPPQAARWMTPPAAEAMPATASSLPVERAGDPASGLVGLVPPGPSALPTATRSELTGRSVAVVGRGARRSLRGIRPYASLRRAGASSRRPMRRRRGGGGRGRAVAWSW